MWNLQNKYNNLKKILEAIEILSKENENSHGLSLEPISKHKKQKKLKKLVVIENNNFARALQKEMPSEMRPLSGGQEKGK